MRLLRRLLPTAATLGVLLVPASAQAGNSPFDANGFHFTSAALSVSASAGNAVVTVQRNNTSMDAKVSYLTQGVGLKCGSVGCTANSPTDFTSESGTLTFPAGVSSESFEVPVVDHGITTLPKTIRISLFGAYPIGVANPHVTVLSVLESSSAAPRDPLNPLALPVAPTNGDPLEGAQFYVSHDTTPAELSNKYPALKVIADEPNTAKFGKFSWPNASVAVSNYLDRAAMVEPGTVPMLSTYRILIGHCHGWADTPADQRSYHNFVEGFANGIGSYRAVLFLEEDSLITAGCLTRHGLAIRMAELNDAINILTADCPHLVIYLDAGAADALPYKRAAKLLRRAGVAKIQGFFLNSTHFDWTLHEIRYGEQISRLTGGKHFVVSTGRGLGPKPTANTGYPNVDAFAWIGNPGESGGACRPGAPKTGSFWLAQALSLIRNANFNVR